MVAGLAILVMAARVAGAAIFAVAAARKFGDAADFAGAVAGYRLLPAWSVRAVARAIPVAEAAVAAGLLVPGLARGAGLAGLLMMLGFTMAIASHLASGRTAIACGCGGAAQMISPSLLVRNGAVLALLALAMTPAGAVAGMGFAVAVFAGGFAVVAYEAAGQLLANAQMLEQGA